MARIEIQRWLQERRKLLAKAARILESAPSEILRDLCAQLPKDGESEERAIRVVFAGQYSAGKSTILKALTGVDDIAVGAGITTEKANGYDWNGIAVVDTPGVHTGLRPDHDVITYEEIASADLLVFVVTNELFDSHLADHFRTLAIELEKGHEMMLVVNKMRRAAGGNTPDAQQVIRTDLERVLSPFTPEQVRLTFIDAESVLMAVDEQDPEVQELLHKKSGFDAFINAFNDFVRAKGLAGRYTTPLRMLEQTLHQALRDESTGDPDIDGLEELLLQRRRALLEAQMRLPQSVNAELQKVTPQIRREGREFAELIHERADRQVLNEQLKAAKDRTQAHADSLRTRIESVVEDHMKRLGDRELQIFESELARELLPRFIARAQMDLGNLGMSADTLAEAASLADAVRSLGSYLIEHSFRPNAGGIKSLADLMNLEQYSGTAIHGVVESVGRFFNKPFKPLEAVKWTRNIANAGRILTVAGLVLTVVLQVKEDLDEARLEADLRESRSAIRAGFNEAAYELEMHFNKTTGAYAAQTIGKQISEVDNQLSELRDMTSSKERITQDLTGLLKDAQALIREMRAHSGTLVMA